VNASLQSPRRSARPARLAILLCAAGISAVGFLGPGARPAAAFSRGETVHFVGDVADPAGHPMPGLTVTLTAARSYFSLRKMQSAEASVRTVSATTDAAGHYALDWPWDDHYNSFVLAVGFPVRKARSGQVEELERRDVSDELVRRAAGGPFATSFTVKNAAYVEKVRRFVGRLASEDERRVYDDMGHPDEVKNVHYADHDEVSWWYFESGKVYRFESGKLAQVVPFDPIKPF
jgi:hypothetical protein